MPSDSRGHAPTTPREDAQTGPPSLVAAALSQLAEGVILADAQGRIIFVNEAAARMHGAVRLDVLPEGYSESYNLLTEDGRPYPSSELPLSRAVLRGDTVVDERWRIRRPDGGETFAVGTARPILGPAGERLGAVLTLRDDTLRVEAGRAERRAARVLDQVADEHMTMDAEFRILSVNRAALRALGKPAEALLGRTHWEAFPASVGSEAERQYRRVAAERVEAHFAHHYVGEGYDRHIEIDAYPTEDGGIAVFWREVSARVHAEAELRARNEELAEQALELEMANQQLQEGAAEFEARTGEAERARAAADEAARRLSFLAEASTRLASSLDYEATLRQIVALAVPDIADWCAYTVDGGDGTVRMVAVHHTDPDRAAFVRELARRYPIRADEPAGAARVLRTGEPELIEQIPDAVLEQVARDGEHLELLRSIGFRSLMTVPVVAQGRVLGALGFGIGESGRRFGPDDVGFAEELARRAAAAVDNARLYREAEAARREAERERRNAQEILEAMADAHFVLDSGFRFTSANAAMERSVGMARESLLGRTIWEAFPETVGTVFESSYRQVAREGGEVHFTAEYAGEGLELVAEVDAYPTAAGGVAVFWRDIAPRRRIEAALAESERQFRTLADAIPTLAWTARADGYIDWYNARWYEYTGATPEQMEGWGWQSVHDPAQLAGVVDRWQASLATGSPFEMIIPLRGADGAFRRFLTRVMPVHDAAGRVLRWFGTNTDVEAERAARDAAEAAEERLREVFEQAPIAVAVLTGPEHVYSIVSPVYARSPGQGRPLLGRTVREAFPELAGTGYWETMDRVYETGEPYSATERGVLIANPADGALEERFFNIGYQPLRDAAGEVYAIASAAYDVTEQVRARQEVEAARADAERQRAHAEAANQAKSQFLSTMSHELRTPLNAIAGYAELLTMGLRGPVTEAQEHDLERIRRANQYLLSLVNDILNFARLDAGQVEYNIAEVDLAALLADVEPLMAPQIAAKGLAFDYEPHDLPHRVSADPEKLRQVLLNLLTNAVKFTGEGGRVAVRCVPDAAAGVMRILVTDTGRGIAAEQLERIFEPFVQVERHRTHESQQGVGLGLAISRDLALGMGGTLAAESEVGVGSTFTLTLPLA
jgi:PAS domain S-box-containing protein